MGLGDVGALLEGDFVDVIPSGGIERASHDSHVD